MTRHLGFGVARLFIMSFPVYLLLPLLLLELLSTPFIVLAIVMLVLGIATFVAELALRWGWPCPRCHQVFDTTKTITGWNHFNVMRFSCIHCGYRIFAPLPLASERVR